MSIAGFDLLMTMIFFALFVCIVIWGEARPKIRIGKMRLRMASKKWHEKAMWIDTQNTKLVLDENVDATSTQT